MGRYNKKPAKTGEMDDRQTLMDALIEEDTQLEMKCLSEANCSMKDVDFKSVKQKITKGNRKNMINKNKNKKVTDSMKILEAARAQQISEGVENNTPISEIDFPEFIKGDEQEDKRDAIGFEDKEINIDKEEEDIFKNFQMMALPPNVQFESRELYSKLIEQKTTSKRNELNKEMLTNLNGMSNNEIMNEQNEIVDRMLHPKLGKLIIEMRPILKKYRSGRLPKLFKVIPSLKNWEAALYISQPHNWSAATIYAATRLFVANLDNQMSQRFYNFVLLPRVRDDIAEYKKLNRHLFMALKRAIFRPAAFFKGIVLPLALDGTCTLREALLLSAILQRCSIPMLHSGAAILRLAEIERYNGVCSIFLKTLLDKKYCLPYRVIDAVVHHFIMFDRANIVDMTTLKDGRLPVIWHQTFLVFVQRYKNDISDEQRSMLYNVCRRHFHEQITPEIRRELHIGHQNRQKKAEIEITDNFASALTFSTDGCFE
ncbi:hypothetical protein SNEBB_010399 [Seison nebaliae]|nr:hypothetical protein SNEBB_010399 [Seison nebaliae]